MTWDRQNRMMSWADNGCTGEPCPRYRKIYHDAQE